MRVWTPDPISPECKDSPQAQKVKPCDGQHAWCSDAQMEGGCLPLSPQAVSLGLTPTALALLTPWELQISLMASEGDTSPWSRFPTILCSHRRSCINVPCCVRCMPTPRLHAPARSLLHPRQCVSIHCSGTLPPFHEMWTRVSYRVAQQVGRQRRPGC